MTEQEKDIRALNFLLLEQKDQINALAAERDRLKLLLKDMNIRQELINFLEWHDSENLGIVFENKSERIDEYLELIKFSNQTAAQHTRKLNN